MLQWVGFFGFNAIMFVACVEAVAAALGDSKTAADVLFSMGGQFMIIAPVAFLAPVMADCLFLGSAICGLKYGRLCAGIFAVCYVAYIVAACALGSQLAEKRRRKESTSQSE